MPDPQVSGYELITAVDRQIEKVRSRALDLSFNELLDMHKNNDHECVEPNKLFKKRYCYIKKIDRSRSVNSLYEREVYCIKDLSQLIVN